MSVILLDLHRSVSPNGGGGRGPHVAKLEIPSQIAAGWLSLIDQAGALERSASMIGIGCIKLYSQLIVADPGPGGRRRISAELEFFGGGVDVVVPKFGKSPRIQWLPSATCRLEASIKREWLASRLESLQPLGAPKPITGIHVY